jgi:hypothetical protein
MDSIPLARALLCLDCDVIYRSEEAGVCPKCGGSSALYLGRVILPLIGQTSSVRGIAEDPPYGRNRP